MTTKPITNPVTYVTLTGAQTAGLFDSSFAPVYGAVNDVQTYQNYFVDSGAANAYVLTLPVGWTNTAGLVAGLLLQWKAVHVNTGASTLNFNGTGVIPILRPGGAPVQGGDIPLNGIVVTQFDGANWQLLSQQVAGAATGFPRGYIDGLILSNDGGTPATVIDIADGVARDSTNTTDLVFPSAFTKSQAAWAPASGGGGKFAAAAIAANAWYHWFLIRSDADGSIDVGFDTTTNASNRPAGYTLYRYIGSWPTQAASTNWDLMYQEQDTFIWKTISTGEDTSTTNPHFATLRVPLGVRVFVTVQMRVRSVNNDTTHAVRVYDPRLTNVTVTNSSDATPSMGLNMNGTAQPNQMSGNASAWTNQNSQVIVAFENVPSAFNMSTMFFVNPRGKNA